jgi:hypothetical protein
MEKQRCEQCGEEFREVKSWQRFCTPRCRDAWHYDQWKHELAQTDATEVNGRGAVDGNAIVEAIKYGRPVEAAPAVAENGLRRRSL